MYKYHQPTVKALVLNDYSESRKYATWIKEGKKLIETRSRLFSYRGDLVICCGASKSKTANAGKALCMVDLWSGRPMVDEDADAACIGNEPGRKSLLLRNWRHFTRDFWFAETAVTKNFQGIFTLRIPDDVFIIDRRDILPYSEPILCDKCHLPTTRHKAPEFRCPITTLF